MNITHNKSNKSFLVACLTAVVAAVSSTLCCIAPLVYLLFGISSSWLIHLGSLSFLQLPMLVISLGAFGYGCWLLFFSKRIICSKYISRQGLVILYSVIFVIILFFLTYPYVLPYLLE